MSLDPNTGAVTFGPTTVVTDDYLHNSLPQSVTVEVWLTNYPTVVAIATYTVEFSIKCEYATINAVTQLTA